MHFQEVKSVEYAPQTDGISASLRPNSQNVLQPTTSRPTRALEWRQEKSSVLVEPIAKVSAQDVETKREPVDSAAQGPTVTVAGQATGAQTEEEHVALPQSDSPYGQPLIEESLTSQLVESPISSAALKSKSSLAEVQQGARHPSSSVPLVISSPVPLHLRSPLGFQEINSQGVETKDKDMAGDVRLGSASARLNAQQNSLINNRDGQMLNPTPTKRHRSTYSHPSGSGTSKRKRLNGITESVPSADERTVTESFLKQGRSNRSTSGAGQQQEPLKPEKDSLGTSGRVTQNINGLKEPHDEPIVAQPKRRKHRHRVVELPSDDDTAAREWRSRTRNPLIANVSPRVTGKRSRAVAASEPTAREGKKRKKQSSKAKRNADNLVSESNDLEVEPFARLKKRKIRSSAKPGTSDVSKHKHSEVQHGAFDPSFHYEGPFSTDRSEQDQMPKKKGQDHGNAASKKLLASPSEKLLNSLEIEPAQPESQPRAQNPKSTRLKGHPAAESTKQEAKHEIFRIKGSMNPLRQPALANQNSSAQSSVDPLAKSPSRRTSSRRPSTPKQWWLADTN